ncbi:MAG: bifunctional DNA primase/polymerase [Alphaproteobacteria bacterium]|nr:bifunctional DNA primase/polymerase [Alphaproteobacteria bacterium]
MMDTQEPTNYSPVLTAALNFASRGKPIFPCNPATKSPLTHHGFKDAVTTPETISTWWQANPHAMIGMPTGEATGVFVLDIDRDETKGIDGFAALHALEEKYGPLPNTLTQRTPRGGEHRYYKWPGLPIKNSASKLGKGLDIRGDGGYIILAPSINSNGLAYKWIRECGPAEAPQWFLELLSKPKPSTKQIIAPKTAIVTTRSREPYAKAALMDECQTVASAMEGQRNTTLNTAALKLGGLVGGGHLDEEVVVRELQVAALAARLPESEASKTIRSGLTAGKAKPREIPESRGRKPGKRSGKLAVGGSQLAGNWYARCLVSERGEVLSNLANAMLALREDKAWRDVLVFDEMQRATLLCRPIRRHDGTPAVAGPFPRPITDNDVGAIQEWLQIAGLPTLSKDTTHQAVDNRAGENAFHPVKQYLDGLQWDGVPRLAGGVTDVGTTIKPWMTQYLGAENNEYVAGIGRMFFIALVARVMQPGCKADYLIILEGIQGIMKSSACAIIGGSWFSDSLPENVAGKDAAQHLRGKWLIEMGELHAMSKAESTTLKAFITRTTEIYRPPYGRCEVHEPRQCVFIGTTNKSVYLRDETGGRRFWPVKVGVTHGLDVDALARDRDQLFAEAVHLFHAGERWWPDREFESAHIKPEQEARFEADAWEDSIATFLADKAHVTVTEVARSALCIETARLGTTEQRRITGILERLEWGRAPRQGTGRRWVPLVTQ